MRLLDRSIRCENAPVSSSGSATVSLLVQPCTSTIGYHLPVASGRLTTGPPDGDLSPLSTGARETVSSPSPRAGALHPRAQDSGSLGADAAACDPLRTGAGSTSSTAAPSVTSARGSRRLMPTPATGRSPAPSTHHARRPSPPRTSPAGGQGLSPSPASSRHPPRPAPTTGDSAPPAIRAAL